MLKIQYHRYGGPEVMQLDDVGQPAPARAQVLVRVKAAATNPADRHVRNGKLRWISGSRFPRGLGHDFAGIVHAIGEGVTRFTPGDRVFGVTSIRDGSAFADYLVAPADAVYPMPRAVSFVTAAALPMASVTAWSAVMDRARVSKGQSIFVTGCLGAVGRAAVQFALTQGATVHGNCSASGLDEATALGVTDPIDYRRFDPVNWRGRFDAVIDPAGSLTLTQMRAMRRRGGVTVPVVITPRILAAALLLPGVRLATGNPTSRIMAGVTTAADLGHLVPKVGRTVALADAIPALLEQERTGLPKGKLVLVPASEADAEPSPAQHV